MIIPEFVNFWAKKSKTHRMKSNQMRFYLIALALFELLWSWNYPLYRIELVFSNGQIKWRLFFFLPFSPEAISPFSEFFIFSRIDVHLWLGQIFALVLLNTTPINVNEFFFLPLLYIHWNGFYNINGKYFWNNLHANGKQRKQPQNVCVCIFNG